MGQEPSIDWYALEGYQEGEPFYEFEERVGNLTKEDGNSAPVTFSLSERFGNNALLVVYGPDVES
jgi:hypothetical protein